MRSSCSATARDELGGSEYLAAVHGLTLGVPPALDLEREGALQRLLVEAIGVRLVQSAHDCADGGLAVTLAESCFDTPLGLTVDVPAVSAPDGWATSPRCSANPPHGSSCRCIQRT